MTSRPAAVPRRLRTPSRCVAVLAATVALAALRVAGANAATTTHLPEADAFVSSSQPTRNFGATSGLFVDGGPTRIAYIRFGLGAAARSVVRATLKVHAETGSSAGFDVGVVSTAWDERTVTYENRPRMSHEVVARSRAYASQRWVSVDVTQAVRAGHKSLALIAAGSTDQKLSSRNGGVARAPRLVIETAAFAAPEAAAKAPAATSSSLPVASLGAWHPYDARSPWNTPIGADPALDPLSSAYVKRVASKGSPLSADVDQYTIPVYEFDATTPRESVKVTGFFPSYDNGDRARVGHGHAPTISGVPVPKGAIASSGTDGQIVLMDRANGVEYAFFRFKRDARGRLTASNGYRYYTGSGYLGRFADGNAGRGAGLPYLAGTVRRHELERGRIDHALAFAYNDPSSRHVYPASTSDGGRRGGRIELDPPEGARFQLDPRLSEADFDAWGLSPKAKVIARALQTYGMYLVDVSGSTKVYLEARQTAGWGPDVHRNLTAKIPLDRFRVVKPPDVR